MTREFTPRDEWVAEMKRVFAAVKEDADDSMQQPAPFGPDELSQLLDSSNDVDSGTFSSASSFHDLDSIDSDLDNDGFSHETRSVYQ